jgi:hypothetical protein
MYHFVEGFYIYVKSYKISVPVSLKGLNFRIFTTKSTYMSFYEDSTKKLC